MAKPPARAFSYRSGVRVHGSILACDAATGSDLIFLSHAHALEAAAARRLPRPGSGKRQVLTTETTLALLAAANPGSKDKLRSFTLTAGYGRPFMIGNMRLELFPSGHLPGAASLLCEREGQRLVYAGPIGADGGEAGDPGDRGIRGIRTCDALCVDGTFAAPRFAFPPPPRPSPSSATPSAPPPVPAGRR